MSWPRTGVPEYTNRAEGKRKEGDKKESYWVSYLDKEGKERQVYFDNEELFDKAEEGKQVIINGFGISDIVTDTPADE